MYLTNWDMLAVMIALVVSVTLVVTTTLANVKLTLSRDEWRKAYYSLKDDYEFESQRIEQGW